MIYDARRHIGKVDAAIWALAGLLVLFMLTINWILELRVGSP